MKLINAMFISYLKSGLFRKSFLNYLLFVAVLAGPTIYLCYNPLNLHALVSIPENIQLNITTLKFARSLPWIVVGVTAILAIVWNTLIYYFTFFLELFSAKQANLKNYFIVINLLFISWGVYFIYTIFYCYQKMKGFLDQASFYAEEASKNKDISSIEIDVKLFSPLKHMVIDTLHQVELNLIATITLFIFIDLLSLIVKNKQIEISEEPHRTEIKLEKDFVRNQLLIVDIPVIIGMVMVLIFLSRAFMRNIPEDLKSIFAVGGIAMHIILSQIIFLVLETQYSYRNFLHKKGQLTDVKHIN